MTHPGLSHEDEISLFALGTTVLRNRWRIARWMLLGAVLAALSVVSKPKSYKAVASFTSQGGGEQGARSGLASLAGQLGVSLPSGGQAMSPDFYVSLLGSRSLLLPVVLDTIAVPELGRQRSSVIDLLGVPKDAQDGRVDDAVKRLKGAMTISVEKTTGIVEITVHSAWRSVSLALVNGLIQSINRYNEETRQGQAGAERKFIGSRLSIASTELRAAEDRMEQFLRSNRDGNGSPALLFQRERLQRDLGLKQQVYAALTQSFEDARAREVRDTPTIMSVESPWAPVQPEPRGRVVRVVLGMLLGAFVGVLLVVTKELIALRRSRGDVDANEFVGVLREMTTGMWGRFQSQ